MPVASDWSTFGTSVVVPLGFLIGILIAVVVWVIYSRMRFGFRSASSRTRRAPRGTPDANAPEDPRGDGSVQGHRGHRRRESDRRLHAHARREPDRAAGGVFGYTGIVMAALARYNPFAVCLVAVLIGGLLNAGYTLQGPDFPSGLVGVMQGIILFCALGAVLLRYRVRIPAYEPERRLRRARA